MGVGMFLFYSGCFSDMFAVDFGGFPNIFNISGQPRRSELVPSPAGSAPNQTVGFLWLAVQNLATTATLSWATGPIDYHTAFSKVSSLCGRS